MEQKKLNKTELDNLIKYKEDTLKELQQIYKELEPTVNRAFKIKMMIDEREKEITYWKGELKNAKN